MIDLSYLSICFTHYPSYPVSVLLVIANSNLFKTAQKRAIFAKNHSKRVSFCKEPLKIVRKRFEKHPYFTFRLRKTPDKSPFRASIPDLLTPDF